MLRNIDDSLSRMKRETNNRVNLDYVLVRDNKVFVIRVSDGMILGKAIADIPGPDALYHMEYDLDYISKIFGGYDDAPEIKKEVNLLRIGVGIVSIREIVMKNLSTSYPETYITVDKKDLINKFNLLEDSYSAMSKGLNKFMVQSIDRGLSIVTTDGIALFTANFFETYYQDDIVCSIKDKSVLKSIKPLLEDMFIDDEVRLSLTKEKFFIESDNAFIHLDTIHQNANRQLKLYNFDEDDMVVDTKEFRKVERGIEGSGREADMKQCEFMTIMDETVVREIGNEENEFIIDAKNPVDFRMLTRLLSTARMRLKSPVYINSTDEVNDTQLITIYDDDQDLMISIGSKKD